MTTTLDIPEIDPALLRDRIEAWETSEQQKRDAEELRRRQPVVRLWDGDWKVGVPVRGALRVNCRWVMNNTGSAEIDLPPGHHLIDWIFDQSQRTTRNLHLTIDKDGARWGGRMKDARIIRHDDGHRIIRLTFLDDYEELKYLQVWSNPFLPAAFQFPRVFILAGPAKYMLKLALFVNLMRQNASLWHLPADPLNPEGWVRGLTPWNWPKVVQPGSIVFDDSQWAITHSRFKTWHDMAAPILADAGLMVVTRRWLDGDPLPYPGAIMRNGQLMFDIVDKSGVYQQTALGGTIAGGLLRTVTKHADNFVDEIVTTVTNPVVPAKYTVSSLLGTDPAWPWVVYRDGEGAGVESSEYVMTPATAVQVNGGGHSAPGVNEGIRLSVQLTGDLISNIIFGMSGLGNIANTLAEPLYKDTILAFYSVRNVIRSTQAGWDHYFEVFADGGDQAYTLSAVMALRAAFWQTRSRESLQLEVGNGYPYLIGDDGRGDFFLGDRIGATVKDLPGGRVIVEQVQELEYEATRERSNWRASLGEPRDQESPVEMSLRQLQGVFGALHDIGVL